MMNAIKRLRIQYASDLHLEFAENFVGPTILKPVAPVLALAGDMGRPDKPMYKNFLRYCSSNWDAVFLVAGNHEFYNSRTIHPARRADTIDHRHAMIEEAIVEFPNIHFLDRGRVNFRGVAFLGCTLWTDTISDTLRAQGAMNDYRMISVDGVNPITPVDTNAWHARDRAWLTEAIEECRSTDTPAVVITHHLPSYEFIASKYRGHYLNFCFASVCDHLIRPPVRAWIAGHTHAAVHRHWIVEGTEVIHGVVNPRGYPHEKDTGYCREIFVDVLTDPVPCSLFDGRDPLLVAATEDGEVESR
jgi:hypothetical protein